MRCKLRVQITADPNIGSLNSFYGHVTVTVQLRSPLKSHKNFLKVAAAIAWIAAAFCDITTLAERRP
jgi:hypothetical protein